MQLLALFNVNNSLSFLNYNHLKKYGDYSKKCIQKFTETFLLPFYCLICMYLTVSLTEKNNEAEDNDFILIKPRST